MEPVPHHQSAYNSNVTGISIEQRAMGCWLIHLTPTAHSYTGISSTVPMVWLEVMIREERKRRSH